MQSDINPIGNPGVVGLILLCVAMLAGFLVMVVAIVNISSLWPFDVATLQSIDVERAEAGEMFIKVASFVVMMLLFLSWALICTIPAHIAQNKGYSYSIFFLFAFVMFLPALVTALCLRGSTMYPF